MLKVTLQKAPLCPGLPVTHLRNGAQMCRTETRSMLTVSGLRRSPDHGLSTVLPSGVRKKAARCGPAQVIVPLFAFAAAVSGAKEFNCSRVHEVDSTHPCAHMVMHLTTVESVLNLDMRHDLLRQSRYEDSNTSPNCRKLFRESPRPLRRPPHRALSSRALSRRAISRQFASLLA